MSSMHKSLEFMQIYQFCMLRCMTNRGWMHFSALRSLTQPCVTVSDTVYLWSRHVTNLCKPVNPLGSVLEIQTIKGAAVEHKSIAILLCSATPCLCNYTSTTIQLGRSLMWDQCEHGMLPSIFDCQALFRKQVQVTWHKYQNKMEEAITTEWDQAYCSGSASLETCIWDSIYQG